jgi:23S rRNA pseudouridine1911/1915/1917 synthase
MNLQVDQADRLDKFLARMLPEHSRSKLTKIIELGEVLVDGKPQKRSFQLEPGMQVTLEEPPDAEPHDLTPADIPLHIVYEDDIMLVVNKPRGLAAHPAASLKEPSLVNALLARGGELSQAGGDFRPGIVHRLDKDTTGLMVVAKTDSAHVSLAKQIEGKSAERRYFAVIAGHLDQEAFTISAPLGRDQRTRLKMAVDPRGKPAVTHVRLLKRLDQGSLIAARLETGRTHQIRVHLRSIGHPVLGDTIYAPREYQAWPLQLHAAYLALNHPDSGERLEFFAAPPTDFLAAEAATLEEVQSRF